MIFRLGSILAFLVAALAMGACSSSDSSAHKKSFWQSFSDFFSPSEEPEGDGELYRELADLDREIHETEWKYSRENRPQKKSRYKSYLVKLRASRDSLADVIEKDANRSSSLPASSSSLFFVSSSSALEKAVCNRADSVVVTTTVTRFVHDTVFVRDTVFLRDTLFLKDSACQMLPAETN